MVVTGDLIVIMVVVTLPLMPKSHYRNYQRYSNVSVLWLCCTVVMASVRLVSLTPMSLSISDSGQVVMLTFVCLCLYNVVLDKGQ